MVLALAEALGAENFASLFEVEQTVTPTKAYTETSCQLPPETRASVCVFVAASSRASAGDVAHLKRQIEKLQADIKKLESVIEGATQPINLGRTSLARVTASSVNGSRSLASVYYGVINAFDDGNNWHNNLNYTYWLSNPNEPSPWVEVHFDHPVTVTSIRVENGPPFSAKLSFAKGGERVLAEPAVDVKLAEAAHGVKSVRLTFADQARNGGGTVVHEIRILGHVPPGVKYSVGRPRVLVDHAQALRAAEEAFHDWGTKVVRASRHEIRKEGDRVLVTFFSDDLAIFRVSLREADGATTVLPLAGLAPIAEPEKKRE